MRRLKINSKKGTAFTATPTISGHLMNTTRNTIGGTRFRTMTDSNTSNMQRDFKERQGDEKF